MSVSLIDSEIYGGLFGDPVVAELFDDRAQIRAMLRVEAALARVEGRLGIIPGSAGERISEVAGDLEIAPGDLAAGTTSAGIPVPALVEALRNAVGPEVGRYVHWGATTQDIMDSALVLSLRDAIAHYQSRIAALVAALAKITERHRATLMVARTRFQQAVPTTFGLKTAGWLAPILRHRERLVDLRPRLLVVSFSGAAGTLSALGERGREVAVALAGELDLAVPDTSWHNGRDGLAEFAGWLSLVSASLAKIARDVLAMAASEVGEVREGGGGGGSSTMPQKANPVRSETLVAIAAKNAALLGAVHQAIPHQHERDGACWQLEWLTLSEMVTLTGAALGAAVSLIDDLICDPVRMRANLDASKGLVLAEAASFALARHIPRPEARQMVKLACREVVAGAGHLLDVLAARTDAPLDWQALADPANHLGDAQGQIERVLAAARRVENASPKEEV